MRHRVASIEGEVEDNLGELMRIDFDVRRFAAVLQMALHGNVFAKEAKERAFHVPDDLVQIEDAILERLAAAEGEELAGEGAGALGGALNFGDLVCDGAFHGSGAEEEIAVAENGGEEIIEVVRDAAGELAEGFHLLRTDHLIVQLLARGDVHERADQAGGLALRVAFDRGALEDLQIIAVRSLEAVFSAPAARRWQAPPEARARCGRDRRDGCFFARS